MYEDDQQLIIALREGQEAAYAQLFDRYYRPLVDYSSRLLQDKASAQDVVQDVFLKVFEHRQMLIPTMQLKAYLYRAVFNYSISHLRHLEVVRAYVDEELLDFYFNEIVQQPDAELTLHNEEMRHYIDQAVAQLPERCREVFQLHQNEGLTYTEIATRLGISIKTVEAHISKAYMLLRTNLRWLLCFVAFYGGDALLQEPTFFIKDAFLSSPPYSETLKSLNLKNIVQNTWRF